MSNNDHEKEGVDVEQKVADVADLLLDVLFDDVSNFLNDVNNFLAMMLRSTKAEDDVETYAGNEVDDLWMILFVSEMSI